MKSSRGQVSSLQKPIQIIVFASIFVVVLIIFVNFELGLKEQSQEFSSQKETLLINEKLTSCLRKDELAGKAVLDQSKLENFEKELTKQQLPCAPAYSYGYNVSVQKDYLEPVRKNIGKKGGQIAIIIDKSGSMGGGGKLSSAESAAKAFIQESDPGIEMSTLAFSIGTQILQDFTTDKESLKNSISLSAGGGTNLANAIDTARGMDWNEETASIMMVMSDGKAGGPDRVGEAGDKARDKGITVHGIMYGSGPSEKETEAYAAADDCKKDDSENTDLDTCWYAANSEQLQNVYEGISSGIEGGAIRVGTDTTCSLPAVPSYEGSADVVFFADSSSSFSDQWKDVCQAVNNTVEKAENKSLDIDVSIYTSSNPGSPEEGAGNPISMSEVGSGDYDYTESNRNMPKCVEASYNNAESSHYGKGITVWETEGIPSYETKKDYGLEAWGVGAKWILENHEWREEIDQKRMIVLGDQAATGGPETGEGYRNSSSASLLANETAIVENISGSALQEGVTVSAYGGDWEYTNSSNKKPFSTNDAKILMKNLSSQTGGSFNSLSDLEEFPEQFTESFKTLALPENRRNFCTEKEYSFGQEYSSGDASQERTLTYPVVVDSGGVRTPGRMSVNLRSGDLERLSGAIKKVIERGKNSGEETSTTLRFNLESSIEATNNFNQNKKLESTYTIQDGIKGDKKISVSDRLILGVNGREVLSKSKNKDDDMIEIDFSKSENSFTAYEGASLQYIAINRDEETGMLLDALELVCKDCSPTETQSVTQEIDVSTGSGEYEERGGIGVFEYDSVPIEIGKSTEVEKPALCTGSGDSRACNAFDISSISNINLEPGNYLLNVRYLPSTDQVVIND